MINAGNGLCARLMVEPDDPTSPDCTSEDLECDDEGADDTGVESRDDEGEN
jgi:hypothetical protein